MNNGQLTQQFQAALRASQQKRWRNVEIILVIHDDPRSKWTVRRILEPAGYGVITADSGPIAVNVIRTIKPRLVVADVRLQGNSAQDLCRQIRAESKTVPFLVLSAIGDVADVVRLLELGADGYMAEPFSPVEFLARVRVAMRHFKI
jgi:DNA-binding response OmpR family regulator